MNDPANTKALSPYLEQIGAALDEYLRFDNEDAMTRAKIWRPALGGKAPQLGVGIDQTLSEMAQHLIPNGSQIPKPGCTSFITTGASNIGALASLASSVAAPQRIGMTAFSYLEELSLDWLAETLSLPGHMKGVYTSGGSVANLLCLGAARQWAFEQLGYDPAEHGVNKPCRVYVSSAGHHTIHRACAVLGMGRSSVSTIQCNSAGEIDVEALELQLEKDSKSANLAVAIVANAGATNTGAIDPIQKMAELAARYNCWLHVDGAYGLPGILDPEVRHKFNGIERADSAIVDPHKWLGAPVGIGTAFVRDRSILQRAFAQGDADYLEGSFVLPESSNDVLQHSMDSMGIPYSDFSVELSAPCRGAVVWALIKEIGIEGIRERVCKHNAMARYVADRAVQEPNLELLIQPSLSICCLRYVDPRIDDLDELNRDIHRQMVHHGVNIPSTSVADGKLAIRPCFIGARTNWQQAKALVDELLTVGKQSVQRAITDKTARQHKQIIIQDTTRYSGEH